jgi:putative tricarboxylic transport membrane protein
MLRRKFVSVALVSGMTAALGLGARAAENLRIIVPAEPGGLWDSLGRSIAEAMNASGSKNVAAENVAGEGGLAGLAQLVNQERGNGNLLMVMGPNMLATSLMRQSPFSIAQATPIARVIGDYEVLVVQANSSIRSLADLIPVLKDDAGRATIAGGAPGSTDHILSGLMVKAAGGDVSRLNYVPLPSTGEILAAVIGGYAAIGVGSYSEWAPAIASGKLRVLGISSPEKLEGVDAPTLKEQGLDVVLASWHGVVAPPGIDEASKQTLISAVEEAVKSDAWQAYRSEKKWTNSYLAGDDFAKQLEAENALTTDILRDVGLLN